ncbi:uncharacterized protein SCHCODRAFT_02489744 [Schizophyllum commune H4-8]|nr:uncharacterized protein SCHCODRAFT_02489744 [Schizophyllum commune H4-8]KAI5897761.1 hypothetical protein SCHCODRAFT_02489744 [Schizophyllum commune H4-8]
MSTETTKVRAKVAALNASLDKLETELAPLLDRPLAETLAGLEPIEKARLQTLLPYIIYDLSFIQLKVNGEDPRTHAVIPELDRVRQYFEKIKKVEESAPKPPTVDKDAAARFIKHAINSIQYKKSDPPQDAPSSSSNAAPVPAKVTDKMREREEYLRELKEREGEESSEGEELEIFGEGAMEVDEPVKPVVKDRKGKGKATETTADQAAVDALRKKRKKTDPFGNDGSQTNTLSMDVDGLEEVSRPTTPSADASAKSKKKRRKSAADADVNKSIVADGAEDAPKKKKKKKAKKE